MAARKLTIWAIKGKAGEMSEARIRLFSEAPKMTESSGINRDGDETVTRTWEGKRIGSYCSEFPATLARMIPIGKPTKLSITIE